MGRSFQMVQKQEFIQSYHFPIASKHPNGHTTNDRPLGIRDELTKGNLKLIQQLHNKWMDGKMKATQQVSLVKAYLPVGKIASFLTQAR